MAIGALLAARELGYRVPEDLSVVGIDGHELGEFFRLTTVDQFPLGQGERAADAILDELEATDAGARCEAAAATCRTSSSCAAPRLARLDALSRASPADGRTATSGRRIGSTP